jgi:hypothetical protein
MDKLWLPPMDIEGRLSVELRDGDTGKLQERIESTNYVTDYVTTLGKWLVRQMFTGRVNPITQNNLTADYGGYDLPNTIQSNTTYQTANRSDNQGTFGPSGVILTDASHAVDATNDRLVRGNITAWSYVDPYSGTDTRRGQQNNAEGVADPTKSKFVFDWPTSSGNGTIQSVYWCAVNFSGTSIISIVGAKELYLPVATGFGDSWQQSYTGVPTNTFTHGVWLDPDGVSYWSLLNTNPNSVLVKRTLGTGAVVSTVSLTSGTNVVNSFTNDGTSWWTLDGNGNVQKWPAAGGAATVTYTAASKGWGNVSNNQSGIPIIWDGSAHLWASPDTRNMYQIDPATGNIIVQFPIPTVVGSYSGGAVLGGGCWFNDPTNGAEMWLSTNGTQWWSVSTTGAVRRMFNTNNGLPGMNLAFSAASGIAPIGVNGYIVIQNNNTGTAVVARTTTSRQFFARSLLASPITKSNTQTMKLTYEFDYS